MKKSKWNLWVKTRSALRDIYRFSPMRRAAINKAMIGTSKQFECSICGEIWPMFAADVDHITPCGSLLTQDDLPGFFDRLMNGSVRVVCKLCHAKVTKAQRTKKAKKGVSKC